MPTWLLLQRHPCQGDLAVLRVIHRCFRTSGIEGRKGCIDVSWYQHFQGRFIANASRFVPAEAGQYGEGGYSGDCESAGNSNQGAPRTGLLASGRLALPARLGRRNVMLCFWLTHVSGTYPLLDQQTMADCRCEDNPASGAGSKPHGTTSSGPPQRRVSNQFSFLPGAHG